MTAIRTRPHDLDAERAVLGACLLRSDPVVDLVAADFYVPAHGTIWEKMHALRDRGQPADASAVGAELAGAAGGIGYLAEIQAEVPTAENADHYARRVRDTARLRALIDACNAVAADAYEHHTDVDGYLAEAEAAIYAATSAHAGNGGVSLREIVTGVYDEFRARAEGKTSGFMLGIPTIDTATHGLQPSTLVILAARPSVGKTTLAAQWAMRAAAEGKPVAIYSLEQSAGEIGERAVVSEGRLAAGAAAVGGFDADGWSAATEAVGRLAGLPVEVDDSPSLTAAQIRSRARRFAARHRDAPAGLIIIDYLQLVRPVSERGRSREQEVSGISRDLKALAKETGWTVIALSQLRRKPSETDEPLLSDLRESGAIEQDADMVAFLHRDKAAQITRLILAKNRNGPTGRANLVFVKQHVRFEVAAPDAAGGDWHD